MMLHVVSMCSNSMPVVRRAVHTSVQLCKIIPNNLKGKSSSSQSWLTRQLNDPYVKRARYENYRARSAFKLIEIDDKFKILKPGMTVVECGAAPGAWSQVLVKRLKSTEANSKSLIICVDKNPFEPLDGATILPKSDFTSPVTQGKILTLLDERLVHLVCSDMAPNATGTVSLDHEAIMNLCASALRFALPVLAKNGAFLTKIWDGARKKELMDLCKKFFDQVQGYKPPSSRENSAELFVLATGFKGIKK